MHDSHVIPCCPWSIHELIPLLESIATNFLWFLTITPWRCGRRHFAIFWVYFYPPWPSWPSVTGPHAVQLFYLVAIHILELFWTDNSDDGDWYGFFPSPRAFLSVGRFLPITAIVLHRYRSCGDPSRRKSQIMACTRWLPTLITIASVFRQHGASMSRFWVTICTSIFTSTPKYINAYSA